MNFSSMQEAEAAAKAGTIKPGDRISVNGKPGTWQ
jgi:C-terminal processing protease CtpA/Prc